MVGREKKRTNNSLQKQHSCRLSGKSKVAQEPKWPTRPELSAVYQGPVKKELLKGAGLQVAEIIVR